LVTAKFLLFPWMQLSGSGPVRRMMMQYKVSSGHSWY
jgi:hypothetical protein